MINRLIKSGNHDFVTDKHVQRLYEVLVEITNLDGKLLLMQATDDLLQKKAEPDEIVRAIFNILPECPIRGEL